MPEYQRHNGYTFFFYSNEGDLTQSPKVFVRSEGREAEFIISHDETPVLFVGRSLGFSAEELGSLRAVLAPGLKKIRSDWSYVFT